MNEYKNRLHLAKEYNEIGKCCKNPQIIVQNGEKICSNCGVVIAPIFSENNRNLYFLEIMEKNRKIYFHNNNCGARTNFLPDRGDSNNNLLTPKNKYIFNRLSKIHNSFMTNMERHNWKSRPILRTLTAKHNIPEHIENLAWKIFILSSKKNLLIGQSIEGFLIASLYASIRIHKFPIIFKELCNNKCKSLKDNSQKSVHRCLKLIVRSVLPEMGLKYVPITPPELIIKFGNMINIPLFIQKEALNIFIQAKNRLNIVGDPRGWAIASLYLASKNNNLRITQKELSKIAQTTEVTIRARIVDLKKIQI